MNGMKWLYNVIKSDSLLRFTKYKVPLPLLLLFLLTPPPLSLFGGLPRRIQPSCQGFSLEVGRLRGTYIDVSPCRILSCTDVDAIPADANCRCRFSV